MRSLRYWWATAAIRDHSHPNPLCIPVATMSLTVVNEFLGHPVMDLDAIDADSLVLGEALWDGDQRAEEFEAHTDGDWGPVALVNSYEVVPEWRGTPLTSLIALRMLDVFAHLDLSAAALYAAPYNTDLPDEQRTAASIKIAAMWKAAGFAHLRPGASPSTDRCRILVRALDPTKGAEDIRVLVGSDPVLRAAADD